MNELLNKAKKISEVDCNYIVIYQDLYGRKYFDRTNTSLSKILERGKQLKEVGYLKIEIHESKRIII